MRHSILIILLQCVCTLASAQTLTIDECRQRALEHNKSLTVAKVKLEQTRFDTKSYRANYYPQVSMMFADIYSTANGDFGIDAFKLPISKLNLATGQYQYDMLTLPDGQQVPNSIIDFPGIKEEWKIKNVMTGGISLLQPVYSGGKISTAYTMSKIGESMAAENIRLTESEVIVNTDEAYILAVKAKQLGDVARSYKTLLEELHKNVSSAVKHGMATRNDLMKVQVKLNEAELNLQKANNGFRLACMNLCHNIGMPLDTNIDVDENSIMHTDGTAPTSNTSSNTGIESRPEYTILDQKTALAKQNVKLSRADMLPNVAVGAAYSYTNGIELAGKKLLDGGAATVGVLVKVPLDAFGSTTNKVRSAKAKLQIAQIEQQDLNEQMHLEVAQCANILSEAKTEVTLCQTALDQAAENMKLSKAQYEAGLEPLSNYLEAQTLWQQSGSNLVQAYCQYHLAQTKYKKATGAM